MTDTTTILTLAGILLLVIYVLADLIASRRLAVRRKVVAVLADGTAISGVLWRRTNRHLIIRDGTVHSDGQQATADGDVIVDRNVVLYLQALEV